MDKRDELYELVTKYIKQQKISCVDTIHQCDWVIESAYNFIANCCEIVGYYNDEEGEEE